MKQPNSLKGVSAQVVVSVANGHISGYSAPRRYHKGPKFYWEEKERTLKQKKGKQNQHIEIIRTEEQNSQLSIRN